jgi:hypothetical protein
MLTNRKINDALINLENKYIEKNNRLESVHNERANQLESVYNERNNQLESTYKERTNQLESTYKERTNQLENAYIDKNNKLESVFNERTNQLENEYVIKLNQLDSDIDNKNRYIDNEFNNRSEILRHEYNAKISDLDIQFNNRLAENVRELDNMFKNRLAEDTAQCVLELKEKESRLDHEYIKLFNDKYHNLSFNQVYDCLFWIKQHKYENLCNEIYIERYLTLKYKNYYLKNILIISDYKLTNKEQKIVNNLLKKKINIIITNNVDNDLIEYDLIYVNSHYSIQYNRDIEYINSNIIKEFVSIQNIIKFLIQSENTLQAKLDFLKNLYEDIPIIVFACGPSLNDADFKLIKRLQDNCLIATLKYSMIKLFDNGIKPDIDFTSDWKGFDFDYEEYINYDALRIHAFKQEILLNNVLSIDLCFSIDENCLSHLETFNNIIKYQDINIIDINEKKIRKKTKLGTDFIMFNLGNSMLEYVIPTCIYSGIKIIYTYGYDGATNNDFVYFNGLCGDFEQIKNIFETPHMNDIKRMLNKNGVYLYKCSNNSPIDLPLFNIKELL